MLGSVNATCLDFPPDPRETTLLMKNVIEQVSSPAPALPCPALTDSDVPQGGLQPGGVLIGVPLRRESGGSRELLEAYVTVIDGFAKALRTATKIVADGVFSRNLQVSPWRAQGRVASSICICERRTESVVIRFALLSFAATLPQLPQRLRRPAVERRGDPGGLRGAREEAAAGRPGGGRAGAGRAWPPGRLKYLKW